MRIIVRPVMDPQREIDLTHRLVSAIAEELWRRYGGNDQLNWLEAELLLQSIVAEAQRGARQTAVLVAPPAAPRSLPSRRRLRLPRQREGVMNRPLRVEPEVAGAGRPRTRQASPHDSAGEADGQAWACPQR